MNTFSQLTVLYTANLQGELHLLPRLFTLVQQARHSANGPVFLLDLGDTCARDAWVCQATQGRAPLIVLDGMGYDAALIGGGENVPIPPAALKQLSADMLMQAVIWQRPKKLNKRGVEITLAPGVEVSTPHAVLAFDRTTNALPEIGAERVVLGDVAQGQLARVDIAWPEWTVTAAQITALDEQTPIDPTVAAVVEMVESEARHYSQTQGGT